MRISDWSSGVCSSDLPKDVIPDQVEVLGFLDDAIMIELCVRELRHELDAYDDFCEYRAHEATKRGVEPATVGQADWLESRREELVDRMHTRRERDVGVGYGSSRGYGGRPSRPEQRSVGKGVVSRVET